MDSQVQVEGRLLDVVDDAWRTETLPLDDIHVRISSTFHYHYAFLTKCRQPVDDSHVRAFGLIIMQLPSSPLVSFLPIFFQIITACWQSLELLHQVPATELRDPEADNANPGDSLRQQVPN